METYLIAGLGNPDKRYENTRHNAGFRAMDTLASRLGTGITEKKFRALCGSCVYSGRKLVLIKPQTYMNLSGEAVRPASDYYHIAPDHIIVLCDDIYLDCGRLRVRGQGSAGGHNGIKSIIACLGTQCFPRIRIGVGAKDNAAMDLADHVLGHFKPEDTAVMEKAFEAAALAALSIVDNGVPGTMNQYNGIDLKL